MSSYCFVVLAASPIQEIVVIEESMQCAWMYFSLVVCNKPGTDIWHHGVYGFQGNTCSLNDSAAYERRASSLDDVVIVSALRTPVTKVRWRQDCGFMLDLVIFSSVRLEGRFPVG